MKGSLTQVVVAIDSVLNALVHQVIGNKSDTTGGDSIVALIKRLIEYANGNVVTAFPAAGAGTAFTAGAADTYGALASVSGALGADSRVVMLDFDTPAVAIEPTLWELSYGAGASVVATGMINFDTAVGTYPPINLLGTCGVIPSGSTLQVRIQSATGGTTCNAHLSTMPAL